MVCGHAFGEQRKPKLETVLLRSPLCFQHSSGKPRGLGWGPRARNVWVFEAALCKGPGHHLGNRSTSTNFDQYIQFVCLHYCIATSYTHRLSALNLSVYSVRSLAVIWLCFSAFSLALAKNPTKPNLTFTCRTKIAYYSISILVVQPLITLQFILTRRLKPRHNQPSTKLLPSLFRLLGRRPSKVTLDQPNVIISD